jgi:sulfate adenylyltransferase subunit 2
MPQRNLSHLKQLEAESIFILREVVAECEKPVMLYSVGKDSACMVRLAQKAFAPGPLPFPLLHIDTTLKFPEMIEFRDQFCKDIGAELIVGSKAEQLEAQCPRDKWTCTMCSNVLKTQALVETLQSHGFDAAFGGARRDEEKSRAKERVLSFRDEFMQWDPKNQRPELWSLYNTSHAKGQSFRVFPLSNWTELDVWHYIYAENIPLPPLYLSKERQIVRRDGMVMVVGDVIKPRPGEKVETARVRFRTLGCQLCTGAVESDADTLEKIIEETMVQTKSERQNRAVDKDRDGSMEEKKKEGYF